ncbi:hypothetical protein AMJ40_04885 [candidate division TA06 bacterium DG_26]|uniref:Porin domain-containing protein n=1 Tax=candidate division TA06 bacterium DG_26 TaxID=1703771 RepID=A0A0S7WHV1_UNCT6|nr:MAG: hypothetical protein AMJ40_04885 [candidate division TA06 bacterium DG_26]
MMKIVAGCALGLLLCTSAGTRDVELFGYFEPQYNGICQDGTYYQFHYNKLRTDLKSRAVKNIEFGADVIYLLYHGKSEWNLLDFLPGHIRSSVPPETHRVLEFAYRDTLFLDNVYARLTLSRFALTAGKQQVSLGTGYFANPTDLFNVKDAIDPTYEQPGHNALRIDFMLNHRLQMMALYSPESNWEKSGKLMRIKAGFGRFDFSVMGSEIEYMVTDFPTMHVRQRQRRVLGGDFVGEFLGLGVWGEGAYSFLKDEEGEDFYEFLVGGDYTFESGLYTMLEHHRNSQGESDYREYDLNDWMRFFIGETRTISRDQLYGFVQYPVSDLLVVGGSVLASVSDRSAVLVPTVEYSLFENVDLVFMLNLYVGDDGKAYGSQMGNGGFIRCRVYF